MFVTTRTIKIGTITHIRILIEYTRYLSSIHKVRSNYGKIHGVRRTTYSTLIIITKRHTGCKVYGVCLRFPLKGRSPHHSHLSQPHSLLSPRSVPPPPSSLLQASTRTSIAFVFSSKRRSIPSSSICPPGNSTNHHHHKRRAIAVVDIIYRTPTDRYHIKCSSKHGGG